ncbi:MAG: HAMP domain-containing histidine kinase [Deltaproteobacteria bacterium]|nr:HAMP domain-containing histidine kinase [Deltaproteobacteria bacterium]
MASLFRGDFRRSVQHAGPVVIAFILGAFLVASSSLSYRDARLAGRLVAERQGIAWMFRLQAMLPPGQAHDARALSTALEAHKAQGLTYVGLVERGAIVAAAGEPLLPDTEPELGSPAFGRGRVRLVSPGPGRRGPALPSNADRPAAAIDVVPDRPDKKRSELFPLPPFLERPPPFIARNSQLVVEFKPIGDADIVRRALVVLILSWGAALLLAAAAVVLWVAARRAEKAAKRLLTQSHLAQLGEMSAVLAHEIRNPLAALKGHAQLLAERIDDIRLKSRVDRVVNEALRLENLTDSLLKFAGSGTIRVGTADPGKLLDRAIAATDADRIKANTSTAPAGWVLDEARVEQVLINLLDNALSVTPSGSKVAAAVSVVNDQLMYVIEDHGPGVPLGDRTRIFDAFHSTKVHGTGLGLSMSKRIVDLHKGTIVVEDAPGGGALFRVCFPHNIESAP